MHRADATAQINSSSVSSASPLERVITFVTIASFVTSSNCSVFKGQDHSILLTGVFPAHSVDSVSKSSGVFEKHNFALFLNGWIRNNFLSFSFQQL
jgi:hypothetical protein